MSRVDCLATCARSTVMSLGALMLLVIAGNAHAALSCDATQAYKVSRVSDWSPVSHWNYAKGDLVSSAQIKVSFPIKKTLATSEHADIAIGYMAQTGWNAEYKAVDIKSDGSSWSLSSGYALQLVSDSGAIATPSQQAYGNGLTITSPTSPTGVIWVDSVVTLNLYQTVATPVAGKLGMFGSGISWRAIAGTSATGRPLIQGCGAAGSISFSNLISMSGLSELLPDVATTCTFNNGEKIQIDLPSVSPTDLREGAPPTSGYTPAEKVISYRCTGSGASEMALGIQGTPAGPGNQSLKTTKDGVGVVIQARTSHNPVVTLAPTLSGRGQTIPLLEGSAVGGGAITLTSYPVRTDASDIQPGVFTANATLKVFIP